MRILCVLLQFIYYLPHIDAKYNIMSDVNFSLFNIDFI